jgi:hypothetical protein
VKHCRNNDPLFLEGVEHKIWKPAQKCLPGPQGDDLMPLGQAPETLHGGVEGEQELEPQPCLLALYHQNACSTSRSASGSR